MVMLELTEGVDLSWKSQGARAFQMEQRELTSYICLFLSGNARVVWKAKVDHFADNGETPSFICTPSNIHRYYAFPAHPVTSFCKSCHLLTSCSGSGSLSHQGISWTNLPDDQSVQPSVLPQSQTVACLVPLGGCGWARTSLFGRSSLPCSHYLLDQVFSLDQAGRFLLPTWCVGKGPP